MAVTLLVGFASFAVTIRTTSGFLVWSDGLGYFLYSRALVLEGHSDITQGYDDLERRYPVHAQSRESVMDSMRVNARRDPRTGRIFTPWPVGAGVVMAPFYALGFATERILAVAMSRPADSFGIVPQLFFGFGSLIFGLLGFWATYLCCRNVAEERWAYLGAIGTVLGGPAVFYIFFNPTMAHAMSFGLVALLTLSWCRQWNEGAGLGSIAVLGGLLGILISVRFQNAIFGILLAALLLLELRRSSWSRALALGCVSFLSALLPLLVQALHAALFGPPTAGLALQPGGLLLVGTYPLHLKSPYFLEVLFSCRHGAFHWAPVLAVGFTGLVWSARREGYARIFLVTILCHVYLIGGLGITDLSDRIGTFDTTNWNKHWKDGASFGMRYLTECTPLFAVGLAGLMQAARKRLVVHWWGAALLVLVVANGLLILSYGLGTVSRSYCVTYQEMATGVGDAMARVFTSVSKE
jgi:hypothetical protein